MPSIHVIRRTNLLALYTRYLVESAETVPTPSANATDTVFAQKIELAKSSFSSYKSGSRVMGERVARQIENRLGLSAGWMDQERDEAAAPSDEKAKLAKFIKLATRAFKRADDAGRQVLTDACLQVLDTRAQ